MKRLLSFFLCAALLLSLSACGAAPGTRSTAPESPAATAPSQTGADTRTVTDRYGRQVEIPAQVNRVICVGSGTLRMLCYLQAQDLLAGVEDTDKGFETSVKRDYAYVNYEKLKDLPAIGKGGGTSYTAYPEEILTVNPDVILCGYTQEAAEQLAQETGLPVVCTRFLSINFIDESFYEALTLMAEVLGRQERCQELLDFVDRCKQDLDQRTGGVPEAEKPTVYAGAVTFSGAHGFGGTYANFGPFLAVHARNVADETGEEGAFEVDLEKVLVWNPDVIFLDPGNWNLVQEEVAANPGFFQSLAAVEAGRVYAMPSFNNYSTNATYALASAYYTGTVLYPTQFQDVDIAAKTDEILTFFLGRAYYGDMTDQGLGFGPLTLGQ